MKAREPQVIWPSGKELEVLRILQSEPTGMYGLQVVEASNKRISRASIYVLLGRLEEKGFVKVLKDPKPAEHPGMPRPIYQLTGAGQRAVSAADLVSGALSEA